MIYIAVYNGVNYLLNECICDNQYNVLFVCFIFNIKIVD